MTTKVTPSQLPVLPGAITDDAILIVQHGGVVAQTTVLSLYNTVKTTLEAYVDQQLQAEYSHVIASITELTELANTKAPMAHNHTAADLGLDKVQNISPLDMPISTATQTALDNKVDIDEPVPGHTLIVNNGTMPDW
jgi:hypothetical protein